MENLRFIAAGPTTISVVPKKIVKVETHESGKSVVKQNIALGYSAKSDRTGWSHIEIFADDSNTYASALAWRCCDDLSNIIFPVLAGKSKTVKIEIAGQFIPPISKEAIHEICRLYRILSPHFSSFSAISQFKLENSRMIEELIFFLIDKVEGHEIELEPWQNEVLRIKRQERESQR